MKFPRWLLGAILVALPVALFWASRRAAAARPVKLGAPWNYPLIYFSPDSRYLVAHKDRIPGEIYLVFDVAQRRLVDRCRDTYATVPPLFSPDGKRIALVEDYTPHTPPHSSAYNFGYPVFHIGEVGAPKTDFVEPDDSSADNEGDITPHQSAVWTGQNVLVVAGRRQVRRFDAATGEQLSRATFRGLPRFKKGQHPVIYTQGFDTVRIAQDGMTMVDWEPPQALVVRDTQLARAKRRIVLPYRDEYPPSFGISARGSVVWIVQHGATYFYDAKTGRALWNWKGLSSGYDLSADEKLVVACNGQHCIARDLKTGVQKWKVQKPNSSIFALSPDGKTFAERRPDGQIWLWPMPQG